MLSNFDILHLVAICKGIIVILGTCGTGGKAANCNGNGKNRSSVVFEEPLKTTTMSNSSTSTAPPHPSASKVATATNRTVNGILRKGSVPGDDIVGPPDKNDKDTLAKLLEANNDRKSAAMTAGNKKSSGSGKNSHSGFKKKSERDGGGSHKLESVTESGLEDGDSTTTTKDTVAGGGTKADRNSRSRSSSSKTSSSKADKAAKDLALTRDLPWCGCWGNGCL